MTSGEDSPRHRFRQKSYDLASVSELSNRPASRMSGNNVCGQVPFSSNRVVHVPRLKVPLFFFENPMTDSLAIRARKLKRSIEK